MIEKINMVVKYPLAELKIRRRGGDPPGPSDSGGGTADESKGGH